MPSTAALLRGINVGGRNLVRMPQLQAALRAAGFADARTYIQSGNVVLTAEPATGPALEARLERILAERLGLPVLVMARSRAELDEIVRAAPEGHGGPDLRSDVVFLRAPTTPADVLAALPTLDPAVDAAAPGPGVVYLSRVAARAGSSRLSRFVSTPVYRTVTVRNWRTTTALRAMLEEG